MKITFNTFCERGSRHENQDIIKVVQDIENERCAFILCDGMGGHSMGGVAAKIVATSIARNICISSRRQSIDMESLISYASMTLDTMSEIYNGARMGTTMVAAYIEGKTLTIAHCGDSRCYVYSKDKELKYRTEDHCEGGYIGAPLTKAFLSGYPEKAQPDIYSVKIDSGDRIFLCSDGVYSCIIPDILRDRMMDNKPLEEIMDTFKFLCERGSDDNYSAILIKIE